jgi:hypothetical protein
VVIRAITTTAIINIKTGTTFVHLEIHENNRYAKVYNATSQIIVSQSDKPLVKVAKPHKVAPTDNTIMIGLGSRIVTIAISPMVAVNIDAISLDIVLELVKRPISEFIPQNKNPKIIPTITIRTNGK